MISDLAEVALGLLLAVYYFLVKLVKLCLPAAWLEKDISGQGDIARLRSHWLIMMLLCKLSYAIKTQLKAPKAVFMA